MYHDTKYIIVCDANLRGFLTHSHYDLIFEIFRDNQIYLTFTNEVPRIAKLLKKPTAASPVSPTILPPTVTSTPALTPMNTVVRSLEESSGHSSSSSSCVEEEKRGDFESSILSTSSDESPSADRLRKQSDSEDESSEEFLLPEKKLFAQVKSPENVYYVGLSSVYKTAIEEQGFNFIEVKRKDLEKRDWLFSLFMELISTEEINLSLDAIFLDMIYHDSDGSPKAQDKKLSLFHKVFNMKVKSLFVQLKSHRQEEFKIDDFYSHLIQLIIQYPYGASEDQQEFIKKLTCYFRELNLYAFFEAMSEYPALMDSRLTPDIVLFFLADFISHSCIPLNYIPLSKMFLDLFHKTDCLKRIEQSMPKNLYLNNESTDSSSEVSLPLNVDDMIEDKIKNWDKNPVFIKVIGRVFFYYNLDSVVKTCMQDSPECMGSILAFLSDLLFQIELDRNNTRIFQKLWLHCIDSINKNRIPSSPETIKNAIHLSLNAKRIFDFFEPDFYLKSNIILLQLLVKHVDDRKCTGQILPFIQKLLIAILGDLKLYQHQRFGRYFEKEMRDLLGKIDKAVLKINGYEETYKSRNVYETEVARDKRENAKTTSISCDADIMGAIAAIQEDRNIPLFECFKSKDWFKCVPGLVRLKAYYLPAIKDNVLELLKITSSLAAWVIVLSAVLHVLPFSISIFAANALTTGLSYFGLKLAAVGFCSNPLNVLSMMLAPILHLSLSDYVLETCRGLFKSKFFSEANVEPVKKQTPAVTTTHQVVVKKIKHVVKLDKLLSMLKECVLPQKECESANMSCSASSERWLPKKKVRWGSVVTPSRKNRKEPSKDSACPKPVLKKPRL